MIKASSLATRLAAASLFLIAALPATAQLRTFSGYNTQFLGRTDDGSTGQVSLGFTANFFGTNYSKLYVNNNGNVTFDSALSTFTPFGLNGANRVIIAPFFADVDTRRAESNPVSFGSGILGGHSAFAVNWINAGGFNQIPYYNTFQLVLIDRSETGAGNFDFEFNYTDVNWETGTHNQSGGNAQGRGGRSARIGYSNGSTNSFELLGSGINGYFLDDAPTGLIYHNLGTPFDGDIVNGRYAFSVRNGEVLPPPVNSAVPEPSTYGLVAAGALLALVARRRNQMKKQD